MVEKVCLPYFIHTGRQIDVLRQAGYFRRIRNVNKYNRKTKVVST